MIENTEILSLGFLVLVMVTMLWLNSIIKIGKYQLLVFIGWCSLLAILALNDFFIPDDSIPPKIVFAMLPPIIFSILFPLTRAGKKVVATANMERLTLIHSLRVIVEALFLYQLANAGLVSDIVTFEGRNFDILPGLSAALIWWLFFKRHSITRKTMLIWNALSLSILLFTISQAILSAPLPFQQFDFEQPTMAIFYFPFILLPGFVAPTMIFSHIIALHRFKDNNIDRDTSL